MRYPEEIDEMENMLKTITEMYSTMSKLARYCDLHSENGDNQSDFHI